MQALLKEIAACQLCKEELPFAPNPILRAHPAARILIIGQAPGIRVHRSKIPWNDPSGNRLRSWMQVDRDCFYDTSIFAIIPMAFCYPGKGSSGDLPPPKACAPKWHPPLLQSLRHLKLIILVGSYACNFYIKKEQGLRLSEIVPKAHSYSPYFPLPHPSPRNIGWFQKNPWFEKEVIPMFRRELHKAMKTHLS